MAFGITAQGFTAKRFADIKTEMQDDYRTAFGTEVNLDDRGPFGQVIAIDSARLEKIWEQLELIYNSQWVETSEGVAVDNALSFVGLTRKDPTFSTVIQTFFGTPGTIVPLGTEVSSSVDSNIIFKTDASVTINSGTGLNDEQRIDFSAVPDSGSWVVDYDGQQTSALAFGITAAQLQTELENLSNVGAGNVSVSGDFALGFAIQFLSALAEQPLEQVTIPTNTLLIGVAVVTATPDTTQEGVLPNASVGATATVEGALAAPSGTVVNIDTPVAGVSSSINGLDAEIGNELESDADAKARRSDSLAAPGHSTLPAIRADLLQVNEVVAVRIFENEDNIEDSSGRPPHSYEAVVQGGLEADIVDILLNTKGAGSKTFGSVINVVPDIQGFDKIIRFSRPTPVPIYLEVAITRNANYPVDGDTQAEAALLAYGNALNIGEDVIVFTQLLCSLNAIPGIIDVEIRLGAALIPAVGSATVTASNDTGDLLFTSAAHGLVVGNRVKFSNVGGALPNGIAADTTYFVVDTNTNDFKVSLTRGGDSILFVDGGSGTNSVNFGGFDDNLSIEDAERADFDSSRITVTSA